MKLDQRVGSRNFAVIVDLDLLHDFPISTIVALKVDFQPVCTKRSEGTKRT